MEDNFLDLAVLDTIPDQILLEDGSVHEAQIVKAEIGEAGENSKSAGQKYLRITMKAVDEPDSRPFNDVFMLPFQGLDQDTFNMRGRMLRDMFKAFDFDYANGWNIFEETDQLVGCTAEVKVTIRESDQYGDSNEVKSYI